MRTNISRVLTILALSLTAFFLMSAEGEAGPPGLNVGAGQELRDAGVDKYLGEFTPVSSTDVGEGWTQHTFDPAFGPTGPEGPVCIAGTPYSVFTKVGNPEKLLIFLQGGGACWQNFYRCNILAEDQAPGMDSEFAGRFGVFDSSNPDNPFADYSIVYMPYCDGSAFGGDNDVGDASFPFGQVRFHRGVRNLSAGMDVARAEFKRPQKIVVMGHSAGGVGVAAFAPFLARFTYGNSKELSVFNDAGPIAVNLGTPPTTTTPPDTAWLSVFARQNDWQFAQFYPESCVLDGRCNPFGQQTGIIDWRLENDSTIREAFYETDSDQTNRFFAQGDGNLMAPEVYRDLILTEHGALNEAYPNRYKRFIVTADNTHGGVQGTAGTANEATGEACFPDNPFLFYTQDANGVPLVEWTRDFLTGGPPGPPGNVWDDIVEDPFAPVVCPVP